MAQPRGGLRLGSSCAPRPHPAERKARPSALSPLPARCAFHSKHPGLGQFLNTPPPQPAPQEVREPQGAGSRWEELPGRRRGPAGSPRKRAAHKQLFLHHPGAPRSASRPRGSSARPRPATCDLRAAPWPRWPPGWKRSGRKNRNCARRLLPQTAGGHFLPLTRLFLSPLTGS